MKNNLSKNNFMLLVGLLLICSVCVAIEVQFKILRRGYDMFVLDNRNHYLSCDQLPTKTEVEKILAQHQDVVQQIHQVAPRFVGVEIDASRCDGKADLLIWYGTHQQRVAIENIVGEETFFGVPYRLQNR